MILRLSLVASVVLLAGCSHFRGHRKPTANAEAQASREPIENVHMEERMAAAALARQSFVIPTCNAVETGPGFQGPNPCGLIAVEVYGSDFVKTFVSELCGGVVDEACEAKHSEMFFARMEERYSYADFEAVSRHCKAWPLKCQDPRDIEDAYLTSHNRGVAAHANVRIAQIADAESREREQAIQRERERREAERAAKEEDHRRRMRALAAIGAAMSKSQSQSQQTTCHTRPTFGGGSTTNCTTN